MLGRLESHFRHNVVAYLALFFALGGTALAAIPGGDAVIDGCYADRTGALRVIDTEADPPQACRDNESVLSWNQQGPKGDMGAAGPQGPEGEKGDLGPAGPAGNAGVSGFVRVTDTREIGGNNFASNSVRCPVGKKAIGGGFSVTWPSTVQANNVTTDSEGWFVGVLSDFHTADGSTAPFPDDSTLKVTVNCASV